MPELVVAPKIDIGVLSVLKGQESAQQANTRIMVQTVFSLGVNFLPRTSSIESLVGKMQKGVAKSTTTHIPNKLM